MAVKIRLARKGRKKKPFYHIVIADARAPRDGKFIEKIGSYNPLTVPATIELDRDLAYDWLMKGAVPTNTARAILKFKGIYYKKHLMRGVLKGALSEDKATEMYQAWINSKEEKVANRVQEEMAKREEFRKMVSGEIKPPKSKEIDAATKEAFSEGAPAENENKTEETPAAEAPVEAKKEEAPVKEEKKEEAPAEAKKEEAPAEAKKEEAPAKEEKKEEAPAEAKKEEAPAKEEKKEEAPAVEKIAAAAAVPAAAAATTGPDDLTKIEGIGPAISKVLNAASINTFAELASTDAGKVKEILEGAEGNFAMHDPTTWPKQSQLASEGKWDELKKWQDELDGGKEA